MRKYIFTILIFFFLFVQFLFAGQVSMALYDFDGDGTDEIVRSDELKGNTFIRFYKRIKDSYFYSPWQVFKVKGRLVQVPEIEDINSDGQKEYFFATGADIGIIYYSPVLKKLVETNSYEFDPFIPGSDNACNNRKLTKKREEYDAQINKEILVKAEKSCHDNKNNISSAGNKDKPRNEKNTITESIKLNAI